MNGKNATAFIGEIFDANVLRPLEKTLVAEKICRARPAGTAKQRGDTVYFNGMADPSIGTNSQSFTYETLSTDRIAMQLDQEAVYAFQVTDIEELLSNVDLQASQAQRAGYRIADTIDQYLLGLYAQGAAGVVTDDTCDEASIIGDISLAARYLKEQNVASGNMWIVLPYWVEQYLNNAGVKWSINEGQEGKGGMQWCKYLGFDVFLSNNVVNTGTSAAPVSYCMFGSYDAIGYQKFILPARYIPLEGKRSVGVDGGAIYGAKVIFPKQLGYAKLTLAASVI